MLGWGRLGEFYYIHGFDRTSHGFTNHVKGEDEDTDEDDDKQDEYQPNTREDRVDEEINEIDLRYYSGGDQ
jgi:hypothetical protein